MLWNRSVCILSFSFNPNDSILDRAGKPLFIFPARNASMNRELQFRADVIGVRRGASEGRPCGTSTPRPDEVYDRRHHCEVRCCGVTGHSSWIVRAMLETPFGPIVCLFLLSDQSASNTSQLIQFERQYLVDKQLSSLRGEEFIGGSSDSIMR